MEAEMAKRPNGAQRVITATELRRNFKAVVQRLRKRLAETAGQSAARRGCVASGEGATRLVPDAVSSSSGCQSPAADSYPQRRSHLCQVIFSVGDDEYFHYISHRHLTPPHMDAFLTALCR